MIFDLFIEIKEIHIDKPVITVQDFLNVDNKLADNLSGIFSVGHNIYSPFAPINRLFFWGNFNISFHVGPFINELKKVQKKNSPSNWKGQFDDGDVIYKAPFFFGLQKRKTLFDWR